MTSTIKTISPSTNKVVCERPETSLTEAQDVARRSKDAFQLFRKVPFAERRTVVERALATIQERKMELGRELSEQIGRPVASAHKEIETMQKRADYLLSIAEEALSNLPGRPERGFKREIKKVPVGPTLVVFAWNVSKPAMMIQLSDLFGKHCTNNVAFHLIVSISHHCQCAGTSFARRQLRHSQAITTGASGRRKDRRNIQRFRAPKERAAGYSIRKPSYT